MVTFRRLLGAAALATAVLALAPRSFAGNPADPANFTDAQYGSGYGQTTGLAWGGRGGHQYLFITNRQGSIFVIRDNVAQGGALTTVSPIFAGPNGGDETGLESIMTDVDFGGANPFVYIFVTEPGNESRIHRFTFSENASGVVSLGSKTPIGPVMPNRAVNHNGGGITMDANGMIYAGIGNCGNGNNVGGNNDLTSLGSKVIRMNRSGTAAGAAAYSGSANANTRYIWGRGFRNPFGLRIRPGGNQLWMSEVGDGQEQIFQITENCNQGWPTENNQNTGNGLLIPKYAYATSASGMGNALTRHVFYNGSVFPTAYQGNLFFLEYGQSRIFRAQMSGDNVISSSVSAFVTSASNPTDICVGPDGALYYCCWGNGQVRRLSYTGALAPSITTQPSAKTATEGQTAQFSVSAGPAGVSYKWQLMPPAGTFADISGATSSTYTTPSTTPSMNNNQYRVIVSNTNGSVTSNAATLTVTPLGPTAATPLFSPPAGSFSGPISVRITTATAGATIRYTTNNTMPTSGSAAYTTPLAVSTTTTIRAIAFPAAPGVNSAEATAVYTITGATPYGVPYREVPTGINVATSAAGMVTTLSATGLFQTPVSGMTPKAGMIPFTVNDALWSDGAVKKRWILLPGSQKITFAANGEWSFPAGTILVKHFDLPISDVNPSLTKRLETRVFYINGTSTFGVTYKWRADNSEADLLTNAAAALDEIQTITTSTGTRTQTWSYPSRDNCLACHNDAAKYVLGVKTRQLNGPYAYPGGVTDNQIRTWNYLQMFTTKLSETAIPGYAKLSAVGDVGSSLEQRAKSYMDSNCAHCHRPGGPQSRSTWDGRYDTALASMAILDEPVHADNLLGLTNPRIVAPGDSANSMLVQRMLALNNQRMPQIASHVVDVEATTTITAWINTLPPAGGTPTAAKDSGGGGGCGLTGLEAVLLLGLLRFTQKRR